MVSEMAAIARGLQATTTWPLSVVIVICLTVMATSCVSGRSRGTFIQEAERIAYSKVAFDDQLRLLTHLARRTFLLRPPNSVTGHLTPLKYEAQHEHFGNTQMDYQLPLNGTVPDLGFVPCWRLRLYVREVPSQNDRREVYHVELTAGAKGSLHSSAMIKASKAAKQAMLEVFGRDTNRIELSRMEIGYGPIIHHREDIAPFGYHVEFATGNSSVVGARHWFVTVLSNKDVPLTRRGLGDPFDAWQGWEFTALKPVQIWVGERSKSAR